MFERITSGRALQGGAAGKLGIFELLDGGDGRLAEDSSEHQAHGGGNRDSRTAARKAGLAVCPSFWRCGGYLCSVTRPAPVHGLLRAVLLICSHGPASEAAKWALVVGGVVRNNTYVLFSAELLPTRL